jgi:hypothetical protein
MDGERAVLVATDPPYLVDYKGGDHPFASADSAARRESKNKDWSHTYREGPSEEPGVVATGTAAGALASASCGAALPCASRPRT